jgi:hypothetical protein
MNFNHSNILKLCKFFYLVYLMTVSSFYKLNIPIFAVHSVSWYNVEFTSKLLTV